MPGRLQDRVALITGSSSGIGRATAFAYAREGAKIVCSDITEDTWRENAPSDEANEPTHERLQKDGFPAAYVHCDVTDPKSVEAAVAAAVKEYGRLDIMVNNAGFALETRVPNPIWDADLEVYKKTMAANVDGVFYGVKYAAKQMMQQEPLANGDRGWILNAASVYGLVGTPAAPAYCTSKGAVSNLTKAAALDCAQHRIHVNSVNPGYIRTHMTDLLFADKDITSQLEEMHPWGRVGNPEDIAKAYVFLASDDAQWMTGVNLPIDGGYLAR